MLKIFAFGSNDTGSNPYSTHSSTGYLKLTKVKVLTRTRGVITLLTRKKSCEKASFMEIILAFRVFLLKTSISFFKLDFGLERTASADTFNRNGVPTTVCMS